MEIIDELLKINEGIRLRVLKGVKVGKYLMSIQGSDGHYCTPRSMAPIDKYYSMELLIFKDDRKYDVWKCKDIKTFPRYHELMSGNHYSPPNSPLGWVGVDLINDLYLHLKGLTRN